MKAQRAPGRPRRSRNTITTKSGKSLKINRTMGDRSKARKESRAAEKAQYLSTLPKNRYKRILYRMHPKRVAKYWFSREGGIMALKIVGISIVIGFFLTIGLFAYFRKDLPKVKDISGDNFGGSNTYYDRSGKILLWQDYDAVKRIGVNSNQISPYMKEATVAIEDKDFYKEGAFNIRGILRAATHDASGGSTEGGSTITQQLVKLNENWTDNRTITRKIKELILATELDREYSKDDILTGYLNVAPYGGVEYGAEAAAEDYFHTTAANLTLAQAAMLAAIPQSPSYYSPYGSTTYNPEADNTFSAPALLGRQQYILDQMAKQGYITQAQADLAKKVNVLSEIQPLSGLYDNIKAPYFVLAAKNELEEKYGSDTVNRGGWKIITTLDMSLQDSAEKIVANNLPSLQKKTAGLADEEATVAENVPTGQIYALVGGVNFNDPDHGKLNYADSVPISPGSSFKPYDYTTLLSNNNNVGAGSIMYDSQGPLPGYPCTNKALPKNGGNCLEDYDFLYPGAIPIRYALGGSRNVPAVKAMLESDPTDKSTDRVQSVNKVINTASAMMDNTYLQSKKQSTYNCYQEGVDVDTATPSDLTQCYGASAIGDGAYLHLDDHVNGLATISREGQAIPRTFILKITDADNNTVYQWKQPKATQVVTADSAYIVDEMASDPNASYLPGSCSATTCYTTPASGDKWQRDNGWTYAVKTGTTNYGFDGLMAGWSPDFAVISWVGNHTRNIDISSKTGVAMEVLTEPLTREVMEAASAGIKPVTWTKPADVKTEPAFVLRNHIHYGDIEPSPSTDLFPSYYVGGNGKTTTATIDKVSGLAATSCTPALAKDTETNADTATFNADMFMGGHPNIASGSSSSTTSSTATDNVHNCNDSPPTITLSAPATCSDSCTISAQVTQGTHALTDPQYPNYPGTVTFTLNGQTINTQHVDASGTVSFTYTPGSSGSGTLAATVTDSVLYSSSDSAQLTYNAASSGLTLNSATQSGGTLTFTWTGGNGGIINVYNSANNSQSVCSSASGSCTATVGTQGAVTGIKVYAEDSSSDMSSYVTISGS
jgi:membrane peptidoglycan carboxypeptidase